MFSIPVKVKSVQDNCIVLEPLSEIEISMIMSCKLQLEITPYDMIEMEDDMK